MRYFAELKILYAIGGKVLLVPAELTVEMVKKKVVFGIAAFSELRSVLTFHAYSYNKSTIWLYFIVILIKLPDFYFNIKFLLIHIGCAFA